MDDENLLRQARCSLRYLVLKLDKMNTFCKVPTILSICRKVFRTVFTKSEFVGFISSWGYHMVDRQSFRRFNV